MSIWTIIMLGMAASALAVFVQIQRWMHDPRRRQLNEEWYRQFDSYRRARYDSREMLDSMEGFSEHFHREPPIIHKDQHRVN